MRKAFIVTAAIVAAVIFFLLATLPPAPASAAGSIDSEIASRTVPGAFHVHSSRSDGAAAKPEIASAAARAGLRFVIFTEHGDGTRPADRPVYIGGVLCIDAVEISTKGGHYVAFDMPPAPYRLGGQASAVVEDVRRLGGFGVVAHPDSGKPELTWRDWSLDVDGLEWISADTEWRDESRTQLVRAFLHYPFRPAAVMASVLDRPVATLRTWDELASRRRIVGLAGHDAHGGIGRGYENGGRGIRGIPSYEASFRSFAIRVIASRALTGEATTDAKLLSAAIRNGSVFTAIDSVATPALLEFGAQQAAAKPSIGGRLPTVGQTTYSVRTTMPAGGRVALLRNGVEVASSDRPELSFESDRPGAYRVEVQVPLAPGDPPTPWLTSNPIYMLPPPVDASPQQIPVEVLSLKESAWRIEKDSESEATLTPIPGGVRLKYRLGSGVTSDFVAVVTALPSPMPDYEAVVFHAESAQPMRLSVQLRFDGGERWERSVYVSPEPRQLTVRARDLVLVETAADRRPDFRRATSLLAVVDLTNAAPGSSGEFVLRDPFLARVR
jgi:hypothetical protein